LLIVLSFATSSARALDAREIFNLAEPSIVTVLASDSGSGKAGVASGVLLAPLEIVTSCGLVQSATDIAVSQGNAVRSGRLRFQDSDRDLCQIHIEEPFPSGRPVVAQALRVEVGSDLFLVSSPRGMERTINRVMVSGLRERAGTPDPMIVIDATIAPASSGGGLFDQDGRLAGIVASPVNDRVLGIPAQWVAELSARAPDRMQAAAPHIPTAAGQAVTGRTSLPGWAPQVGDRWSYRLTHGTRRVGVTTIEVVKVHENAVRERVTFDTTRSYNAEREVDLNFKPTRLQPLVLLPGGYQILELAPYPSPDITFERGQRWIDIPGEFAPQGSTRRKVILQARTMGPETIRVPAGEYKAWKIETVSNTVDFNGVRFNVRCQFWYAPEHKRAVKMNLVTESSVAVLSNSETYELVSFDSAP
jgi:hypothetical protein